MSCITVCLHDCGTCVLYLLRTAILNQQQCSSTLPLSVFCSYLGNLAEVLQAVGKLSEAEPLLVRAMNMSFAHQVTSVSSSDDIR
jgi:hypothetical protein